MPVVFISYRRSDSQDVTGRIYDRLVGKFTPKQVFKDVDNIPLGVSFPMHIKQMLGKAGVGLVVIGPTWTTATDEEGRRRLDDPNDFVRLEVEMALRANMPVIPILVSNAKMPSANQLPASLQKLVSRNGMAVRPDPDFNNDITRLFSGLEHLDNLLGNKSGERKEAIKWAIVVPDEEIKVEVVPEVILVPTKAPTRKPKSVDVKPPPQPAPARKPRPRRSGSPLFWITAFLLTAAAGGVAWFLYGDQAPALWEKAKRGFGPLAGSKKLDGNVAVTPDDFKNQAGGIKDGDSKKDAGPKVELPREPEPKKDDIKIIFDQGLIFSAKSNHKEAIEAFTKTLERNANYPRAHFERGRCHYLLEQHNQAIADLTKAAWAEPAFSLIFSYRAAAYYSKGQYDQAIADCTTAISLGNGGYSDYMNRGNAYQIKGEFALAQKDFAAAKKLKK